MTPDGNNSGSPRYAALLLAALLLILPGTSLADQTVLRLGDFSKIPPGETLPPLWEPLTFKKIEKHTRYRLVTDGDLTVIAAESRQAASGLIRKVPIDPREFPNIVWRWKVANVFNKGDVSRKDGDDYPARIYITFVYDPDQVGFLEKAKFKAAKLLYGETPPIGAINYIWANRAPKGQIIANAYTERVKMIVIQSGLARAGKWVVEKRNVYADYKEAFGREPTAISGVAIMTDSDNTGESARAWYGDIVFSAK